MNYYKEQNKVGTGYRPFFGEGNQSICPAMNSSLETLYEASKFPNLFWKELDSSKKNAHSENRMD